ncbi:hypothetical protein V9T40_002809 [Parthenolecanium corni]|uniref:Uncharacterized protein n=1 Tax=Parthenolecanium corni TaxID=536013 RepID=A0AAN9Y430_9HEMI
MYKYEAELVPANSSNTRIQPVEVTSSSTPTKNFSSFGNEKRELRTTRNTRNPKIRRETKRNETKRKHNRSQRTTRPEALGCFHTNVMKRFGS